MKVRVCPKCGKHNPESVWHCADCGETLGVNTLVDTEAPQKLDVMRNISRPYHEDVAELVGTIIQSGESVIRGYDITQIIGGEAFAFGYLVITSQRLIRVQFESETKRRASSWLAAAGNPLSFLVKEAVGVNVRPERPLIGGVPAVNRPSYPLTPKEKASRKMAIHDLENLVSADLASSWYGEIVVTNLTMRFRQGEEMTVTFYAPHEAEETHKLLAARLGK